MIKFSKKILETKGTEKRKVWTNISPPKNVRLYMKKRHEQKHRLKFSKSNSRNYKTFSLAIQWTRIQ